MADIFLSYAREDIKKAEILANALASQGWTIFWDRTSLLAGQDFETVIEQAIQEARCMVVAWSQASKQSDWVRGEAGIGRERNILIPILFELVAPPIAFRSLHTEKLIDWDGDVKSPDFMRLCTAIDVCIKRKKALDPVSLPANNTTNKAANNSKRRSFMRFIRQAWDWFSVTKHQQTLAFFGSGLLLVVTGSWQVYLHFSEKHKEPKQIINLPNIVVASNPNTKDTGTGEALTPGKLITNERNANYLASLGNLYADRQEFDRAEEYYLKALKLHESIHSKEGMARDSGNLGSLYLTHGRLEKAEEYLQNALELNESLGNNQGMALNFGNLGFLYQSRKDFTKAEENFQKALKLVEGMSNKNDMAIYYNALGIIYMTRGELGKAEEYLQKALRTNESLDNKQNMAIIQANFGFLYTKKGRKEQAQQAYQKSIDLFQELGNTDKVKELQDRLNGLKK